MSESKFGLNLNRPVSDGEVKFRMFSILCLFFAGGLCRWWEMPRLGRFFIFWGIGVAVLTMVRLRRTKQARD